MTCYNSSFADAFNNKAKPGSIAVFMNDGDEIFNPIRAFNTRNALKKYLNSELHYEAGFSPYDFMLVSLLEGGFSDRIINPEEDSSKIIGVPQMVVAGKNKDGSVINPQYLANIRLHNFRSGQPLFTEEEILRLKTNPVIQYFNSDIETEIKLVQNTLTAYNDNNISEILHEKTTHWSHISKFLAFSVVALPPVNLKENTLALNIRAEIFSDKKVTPKEDAILEKIDNMYFFDRKIDDKEAAQLQELNKSLLTPQFKATDKNRGK